MTTPHDPTGGEYPAQAVGLVGDGQPEQVTTLLATGRRMSPDDVRLRLEQVAQAEVAGDWARAIALVEEVIEHAPDTRTAYRGASVLCRRLDRDYDAEMILVQGMCRFPDDLDIFAEYAAIAEARQDWKQATRRTQLLCDRFPSYGPAYTRLATALRRSNRTQEAEQVLQHGARQAPDDLNLLIDYAELAAERTDWIEAARRFETARIRFPGNWWAHKRTADMLKRAGKASDAETVLLDGQRRAPDEPGLFADHAELAVETHGQAEALQRYELLRERFPNFWWSWKRVGDILKTTGRDTEAEAVLLDGQRRFPDERGLFVDYAELAAERRDWPAALKRFELLRERCPDFWWSWKRIADILKATGRDTEAEAELLDGQQRFPEERQLFLDHAELVADRQDWPDALRRFEHLRERFPDFWWSWKRIADILRTTGKIPEAEAVLLDGQRHFAEDMALFFDHAELAALRKDWGEALRRLDVIKDVFPSEWWSFRRMAELARFLERFDDAERILLEGQQRFPDEIELLFDHADLAHRASRYQEALERYQAAHERFPHNYWSYVRLARALKAAARPEEAEAMLIDTIAAFPDEPATVVELCFVTGQIEADARRIPLSDVGRMLADRIGRDGETAELLGARAHLAQLSGNYADYMRELLELAARYPTTLGLQEKIVAAREILLGTGDAVPGESDGDAAASRVPGDMPQTSKELFARFESLGGGGSEGSTLYGCEFGFAQRNLEIEPLSLLRWTGVSLPNLTRLFTADFADIGHPETTVLKNVATQDDWLAVDTRYGLHCDHTHLDRLAVPHEQAVKMMCQRMGFLARKLREDLEDGEKIFVYRYMGTVEDEAEMLALAQAVNGFGNNMLFFVCRADPRHPPFTVRRVRPGLLVGHLDWFAYDRFQPPNDGFPANMAGWTRICETAYRLWRNPEPAE